MIMTDYSGVMTSRQHSLRPQQDTQIGWWSDMYDSVAILKSNPVATYDSEGNETITYTDRQVFVYPRGVYNAEFYNAAQLGLQPTLTLTLTNRADYCGEKLLEFEGKIYTVIRTDWTAQRDAISLICEERVGND